MSKGFKQTIAVIALVVISVAGGISYAEDFADTTELTRPLMQFRRSGILEPGQSIVTDVGIPPLATKTVPAGRWATYNIRVDVQLTDVDPTPVP